MTSHKHQVKTHWHTRLKAAVGLILGLCATSAVGNNLALRTSLAPPYQIVVEGRLEGVSVDTLRCVFAELDVDYEIDLVPSKRAEYDVRRGYADGYFSVIQNQQADTFARLSSPLAMEKWFLVSRSDYPAPNIYQLGDSAVGALLGSNEALWFERAHEQPAEQPGEMRQLVQQLASGRIDAFIADRRLLTEAVSYWPEDTLNLRLQFLRYAELGLYFGHHFLQEKPDFLFEFNHALGQCQQLTMVLTKAEQDYLIDAGQKFIAQLKDADILQDALRERYQHPYTTAQIAEYEQQWRHEFGSGEYSFIASMQSNSLSGWLLNQSVAERDGFTELFVFDAQGANVGFSRVTSDFDQSDENKYQQTIGRSDGRTDAAPYLSEIRYDRSTQRFQAQYTQVIYSREKEATPLGAMTIGLDVEYLLSGKSVPLSVVLENED